MLQKSKQSYQQYTKTRNENQVLQRVNRVINSTLKQGIKSGAPESKQRVINSRLKQGMKSDAPEE